MGLGKEVLFDVKDGTAVVTLNRPEKLNTLTEDVLAGLSEAFFRVEADRSLSSLVITGAGEQAFTAGIDINSFGDYPSARSFVVRELTILYDRAVRLPVPVIAAIEGYAYATGCEFTACCDIVYAGQGARFCFPDLNLGIIPALAAWGQVNKLHRMKTTELMFTAEEFGPQKAEEIGLVTRVVPQGRALDAALVTAATISKKAPLSVRALKKALNIDYGDDWMRSIEIESPLFASADFAEGVRAFLQKGAPKWTGQ